MPDPVIAFGVVCGALAFLGGIAWLVAQVYAEQERRRNEEEARRRSRSVQAVLDRRTKK